LIAGAGPDQADMPGGKHYYRDNRPAAWGMRRISSSLTFFYKRVFPTIWFGFLALFVVMSSVATYAKARQGDAASMLPFLAMPAVMAIFGFLLFRKLIFDLVDEVWLDGDDLLIKNRGEEIHIALREVMNINASTMMNPRRITLMLRTESNMGREISFMPAISSRSFYLGFKPDPIAAELIEHLDALRTNPR
jgi:hypothetical protein